MPALIGAVMAVLYYFQIKREEQRLTTTFGSEYEMYTANVPRFFPSHRAYVEPASVSVCPHVMKRGLFGIAFLLLLIGVVEYLEYLHNVGYLPVLLQVY